MTLVNVYPPEAIKQRILAYVAQYPPPVWDQEKHDKVAKLFGTTLTGRPGWDPNHAGILLGWLFLPYTTALTPVLFDDLNSTEIAALWVWSGLERDKVKPGFELELHQVCTRAIYDYRRTTAFAALGRPNKLGDIIDLANKDFGPVQVETDSVMAQTIRSGGIPVQDITDQPAPKHNIAGTVPLGKAVSAVASNITLDTPEPPNAPAPTVPKPPAKRPLFYPK